MTELVVDASAVVKWFFEEDNTEDALRLLEEQYELHAPGFALLEVDSVVSKRVRRGLITARDGAAVRDAVRRMPIVIHDTAPLADPAYELSVASGSAVYDCLYVALAELLGNRVATADRRLVDNLQSAGMGNRALWIGDLE